MKPPTATITRAPKIHPKTAPQMTPGERPNGRRFRRGSQTTGQGGVGGGHRGDVNSSAHKTSLGLWEWVPMNWRVLIESTVPLHCKLGSQCLSGCSSPLTSFLKCHCVQEPMCKIENQAATPWLRLAWARGVSQEVWQSDQRSKTLRPAVPPLAFWDY